MRKDGLTWSTSIYTTSYMSSMHIIYAASFCFFAFT